MFRVIRCQTTSFETLTGTLTLSSKIPSRSEDINEMQTKFPLSENDFHKMTCTLHFPFDMWTEISLNIT